MKKFLAVFLLAFSTVAFATDYYVSINGNDSNHGKSPDKAFATIERVNQLKLKPGDNILFERGGLFFGELVLVHSGKPEKPITIAAYGEGKAKSVLTGAVSLTEWENVKGNLFRCTVSLPVKQLYSGNSYLPQGHLPNQGYFFMDQDGGRETLIDSELDNYTDLVGATVRVQTVNWQWENREIIEFESGKIKLDSQLWHPTQKDFGYYLENKLAFVDQPGEWFYNAEEGKLYLMWEGDIKTAGIGAVVSENGIDIGEGLSNIVIKDLTIEKYSNAAVNVGMGASTISVSGNEIADIEVFGVSLGKGCESCNVLNNVIKDVQGRGITTLQPRNCKFVGNKIRRIGMVAGRGFNGVNSGVGICMENRESRDAENRVAAGNNLIAKNRVDSTGYGGIRADGAFNTIEYNVVRDAVLTMNDGAGIYTWGSNYNYSHHSIFRKNVVVDVHGNTESCAGHHKIICALYMDNYSNNSLIEDNVFVCEETGIILNDLSHSHTVRGNKVYGANTGISYSVWRNRITDDTIRGNYHVTNNIMYSKGGDARLIDYSNHIMANYKMGVLDSNLYISPVSHDLFSTMKNYGTYKVTTDFTINAWREKIGYDLNSKVIGPNPGSKTWQMEDRSTILVNDTEVPMEFNLGNEVFTGIHEEEVSGKVTVAPYDAIILFKR